MVEKCSSRPIRPSFPHFGRGGCPLVLRAANQRRRSAFSSIFTLAGAGFLPCFYFIFFSSFFFFLFFLILLFFVLVRLAGLLTVENADRVGCLGGGKRKIDRRHMSEPYGATICGCYCRRCYHYCSDGGCRGGGGSFLHACLTADRAVSRTRREANGCAHCTWSDLPT